MKCLFPLFAFFTLLAGTCLGQESATPKPAASTSATAPEATTVKVSGPMKLTLRNNIMFEGTPVGIENIKITTLFGEVSLPLHTILGIRFAQGPKEQTTVVGLNGDALTGSLQLSELKFVSEWGEATVNAAHLVSIVFQPDLAWTQVSTPNGPRWQLTKTREGSVSNEYVPSPTQGGRRTYTPSR
jgi:hypothetical protein